MFYSIGDHSIAPQEPHTCDYLGEAGTHICAGEVVSLVQGRWSTKKAIIKNDYTLAQEPIGPVGDLSAPDGHEFSMIDNGRAYLQPVYQPKTADLTPYGAGVDGLILDGCFQEVSVETGEEVFSWCYMDHFHISKTYIYLDVPGNTVNITSHLAGLGDDVKPWDAFHINSLDKNSEGDYLVSFRHTNEVIKVAGKHNEPGIEEGAVMWKLGGKKSDFVMADGLIFSRQHHVRYVTTSDSETTISMFDNAWEGDNPPSADHSAGKIITINHTSKEARLVKEFRNSAIPTSMAGGCMQHLSNENMLIGWGWQPAVTEFDRNGNILFDARISSVSGVFSYRTQKFPWVGKPRWKPKLLAYSQTCSSRDSPLTAYVSWNGATEVVAWRFYVSFSLETGPWIPAGTFPKTGFETSAVLSSKNILGRFPFVAYVSVEALDSAGQVIGDTVARTWVPPIEDRGIHCLEDGCNVPYFDYPEEDNSSDTCRTETDVFIVIPGLFALVVVFIGIELASMFYTSVLERYDLLGEERYIALSTVELA